MSQKPYKVLNTAEFCIKHICVLLLLGKSNSKVYVFNVLMLKTVRFCFKSFILPYKLSLCPCAVSYSACVLSYDTVSQSLQHVCKHSAQTVHAIDLYYVCGLLRLRTLLHWQALRTSSAYADSCLHCKL